MDYNLNELPKRFGGMSGGGLWRIYFVEDEKESRIIATMLCGIASWQIDDRKIACQGWDRIDQDEDNFYNEVVKFVRGEGHDIRPGTIGMIMAEIAKRLVAESPDLLAEDKRPDLIKAVNMIYDRDHAVVVNLTD